MKIRFFVIVIILFLSLRLDAERNRVIHFSIDDTIIVFQNLTKNKNKYKTAFDEPLLKQLKKLNKEFGLKVTLYVFYERDGFSLSDCTENFVVEFQKNSDWLKFAYHAFNEQEVFKNDFENNKGTVNSWYDKTIKELLRITGSKNCISDTVRLHYFKGEKEDVTGIRALLTADKEPRPSYFLNEVQENELFQKEKIFDDDTGIYFYKTDFRLDEPKSFKSLFEQNKTESEVVFFTHEWLLDIRPRKNIFAWFLSIIRRKQIFSNLKKVCAYAKDENMKFVMNCEDFYAR